MTINIVALIIMLFGACVFGESMFTSIQMLWVNLIMDSFAALALATEPPNTADLLGRQPISKLEQIINPIMWRNIFGHSIY
jgi:magnesium-transporting ATPase (P-type)